MTKKKKGLQVNHTAAELIKLKTANPLTEQQKKGKVKSKFVKLQERTDFVNGENVGRKISDLFGTFTGYNQTQTPVFKEEDLPTSGVQRMQQMEDVEIKTHKKDKTFLYLGMAVILLIIFKL